MPWLSCAYKAAAIIAIRAQPSVTFGRNQQLIDVVTRNDDAEISMSGKIKEEMSLRLKKRLASLSCFPSPEES